MADDVLFAANDYFSNQGNEMNRIRNVVKDASFENDHSKHLTADVYESWKESVPILNIFYDYDYYDYNSNGTE